MDKIINVAVLVGSLRKGSFSRMVAAALIQLAAPGMKAAIVEIDDLPLYNQDEENDPPVSWLSFRERIRTAAAILFVTPEYNRSVPGVLKNAIDVGSRPYGKSAWARKPAAIMSTSPGAIGGFGANHHLRQSLVFLDMPCMQQPEAYVGHVDKLFDNEGRLTNKDTEKFFDGFMQSFAAWSAKNAAA